MQSNFILSAPWRDDLAETEAAFLRKRGCGHGSQGHIKLSIFDTDGDDPLALQVGSRDHITAPIRSRLPTLPLADASAYGMVLQHVLDVVEQPGELLAEVHDVLRPGAALLALCFNPLSLLRMRRDVFSPAAPIGWMSARRIRQMAYQAGLVDVRIQSMALGWPWRRAEAVASPLGSVLIVDARRPSHPGTPIRLRSPAPGKLRALLTSTTHNNETR